ncbi:HvfC family RiPP maturation protein [Arsukibacterium sp.]|uniref:HvfC family RiPP maturation protein n=1 Tax=Arsukibacterium sp. TaxID=1977258 RepID=UPI002FD8B728
MATLKHTQLMFANYIRSPDTQPPPEGIASERLQVYRELFFNNVCNFINNAFPVLARIYHSTPQYQAQWQALQQQFFSQYPCQSPYFLHIAEQFVDFVQNSPLQGQHPPFLAELAHYEWAELYVGTVKDSTEQPALTLAELQQVPLALSERAMLAAYRFPVQRLAEDFQPDTADEPSFFLIYRNAEDNVVFVNLNQASLLLLHHLSEAAGLTFNQLLQRMYPLLPQLSPAQIQVAADTLLTDLAEKGVIVSAL